MIIFLLKIKSRTKIEFKMARTMFKTKQPFDILFYWNEYINYINQEFSAPEENNKWTQQVDIEKMMVIICYRWTFQALI